MNALLFSLCVLSRLFTSTSDTPAIASRVGLTPTVLAASGLGVQGAQAVLGAIGEATQARSALSSAESDLESAITQIDSLTAQIEASQDPELAAQRAAVESTLPALRAAIVSARSELVNAGLTGADSEAAERVRRILSNQGVKVPLSMRVLNLTPSEFETLAVALIAESAQLRQDPSNSGIDGHALAQEYRTRSEVVAAESALAANRVVVEGVFAQWE